MQSGVPATNALDLKLDQLAAERGYFLFSKILLLSPGTASDIDDSTLVGIARDAFLEMRSKNDQNWTEVKRVLKSSPRTMSLSLPKKGLPEAVAAMLVNNQIFISSSMKKVHLKPSFRMTRQGNKRVNRLLSSVCKLCGNMEEHPDESTHFYGANCAEIMVLHQWANYGGGRTAELRKGKIVTIGRDYESSKETAVKIKAPCRPGSKNGYACGPLLIGLALRALDENTVIPATTRDLGLGTATQVTVLYPPNLVDRISLVEEMVCYHNSLTY